MNQSKKRRSGPLELIIHARVSSLVVSNQLLHKVYKYKATTNTQIQSKDKYKIQSTIQEKYTKKLNTFCISLKSVKLLCANCANAIKAKIQFFYQNY